MGFRDADIRGARHLPLSPPLIPNCDWQILSGRLPFWDITNDMAVIGALMVRKERPPMTPVSSAAGRSYQPEWNAASQAWNEDPARRPSMLTISQWHFASASYALSSNTLTLSEALFNDVAVSPDGTRIAAVSSRSDQRGSLALHLWNLSTDTVDVHALPHPQSSSRSCGLKFFPDGTHLVILTEDSYFSAGPRATLFHVQRQAILATMLCGHVGMYLSGVGVSADNATIAVTGRSGVLVATIPSASQRHLKLSSIRKIISPLQFEDPSTLSFMTHRFVYKWSFDEPAPKNVEYIPVDADYYSRVESTKEGSMFAYSNGNSTLDPPIPPSVLRIENGDFFPVWKNELPVPGCQIALPPAGDVLIVGTPAVPSGRQATLKKLDVASGHVRQEMKVPDDCQNWAHFRVSQETCSSDGKIFALLNDKRDTIYALRDAEELSQSAET